MNRSSKPVGIQLSKRSRAAKGCLAGFWALFIGRSIDFPRHNTYNSGLVGVMLKVVSEAAGDAEVITFM